ncbi:MAG: ribosome silencing factor [Elusimicrobiota bacterium]
MERIGRRELTESIADVIISKKGSETLIYDVSSITSFTEYIVITSVNSKVQMDAIHKELERSVSPRPDHVEGESSSGWVLLDYDSVIVNIFLEPVREFYRLERLWGDAQKVEFKCMK